MPTLVCWKVKLNRAVEIPVYFWCFAAVMIQVGRSIRPTNI